MKETRNQQRQASQTPLQPNEATLLDRFRRLKDKQQSFVLRSMNLLLQNESVRPSTRKAEHALVAVKWRVQGDRPFKTIEQCSGIWENPNGMRFDIVDSNTGSPQIFGVQDVDVPD